MIPRTSRAHISVTQFQSQPVLDLPCHYLTQLQIHNHLSLSGGRQGQGSQPGGLWKCLGQHWKQPWDLPAVEMATSHTLDRAVHF